MPSQPLLFLLFTYLEYGGSAGSSIDRPVHTKASEPRSTLVLEGWAISSTPGRVEGHWRGGDSGGGRTDGLIELAAARAASGLVNQAVVDGVEGQLQAVGDAELVEDVVQVVLDGLFADKEFLADFLVAITLGH